MRAILQQHYGTIDDLVLGERPVPEPEPDELLIRVHAASVHADVWHVVTGRPYAMRIMGSGVRRPKEHVPGTDVAGVVTAVGSAVSGFEVGDEVLAETVRGIPWHNGGAFAEFATAPARKTAHKPANVSFVEAAAVPTSGMIAMDCLFEQGRLQRGDRVLIVGAGGSLGTLAVQLAVAHGATVTAVDSAPKLDMLARLGADRVLDHAATDPAAEEVEYDLILDVPGVVAWRRWKHRLTHAGRYVLVGHDAYGIGVGPWLGAMRKVMPLLARSPFTSQLPGFSTGAPPEERMAALAAMLADGTLTPAIDRTFPLADTAAALHHLASGAALGKVVVVPVQSPTP